MVANRKARQDEYPQVHWALVSVFLLFIVFRYLEGGERLPSLGALRFEFLLGLVLSIIGIVTYVQRKSPVSTPALTWALLLVGWMLLMIPLSVSPSLSWTTFVDRVIKFMMVAILIAAFVTTPTILRWFLAAWLFAFAKMTQEGVHGIITGSLMWENQGIMRLHGPTGSYLHANTFAGTQLITLPFLYHLYPLASKYLRYLMIAQAIGVLAIILYCGSRTSYLGFFAWLAVLIAQSKKKFRALAAVILLALVVTPFLPEQYIGRLESVVTQKEAEGASSETRKEILRDAWQIFLESPITGVGPAAFPIVRDRKFGRQQDTHNLYLEVATNLGIIGLVLFVGLALSMVRSLFRHARTMAEQSERVSKRMTDMTEVAQDQPLLQELTRHWKDLRLMRATALATSSFLIIRLANGMFGHDMFEVYWWFVLGIVIALTRMGHIATVKTEALTQRAALDRAAAVVSQQPQSMRPTTA
jgi:putative inorganic carbon (HCO3(-)) transporter